MPKPSRKKNARKVDPLTLRLFRDEPTKGERRKAAIVEAAIVCLAKLGIEATSLENIGKQSGIGKSHVLYYFADKGEILEACIRLITTKAQEITVARIAQATTDRERFLAVLEGAFDWAEAFPDHVTVMLLFYYFCAYDPKYRALHQVIRTAGEGRIEALLSETVPAAHAGALARQIQGLITAGLMAAFTTNRGRPLREWRDEVRGAVLCLYDHFGRISMEPRRN